MKKVTKEEMEFLVLKLLTNIINEVSDETIEEIRSLGSVVYHQVELGNEKAFEF